MTITNGLTKLIERLRLLLIACETQVLTGPSGAAWRINVETCSQAILVLSAKPDRTSEALIVADQLQELLEHLCDTGGAETRSAVARGRELYLRTAIHILQNLNTHIPPLDRCQFCFGLKGGVDGNGNVLKGVLVCDRCAALISHIRS